MNGQNSRNGNTDEVGKTIAEPLWTVDDVAAYLRLEAETVRKMARNGRLPAIKLGRVWRFRREEIAEWVQHA